MDISIVNHLENRLNLAQAILLYAIYETEIINRINKVRHPMWQKLVSYFPVDNKYYFDFNKYAKLREVYNGLPDQVKEALAKYVKNL